MAPVTNLPAPGVPVPAEALRLPAAQALVHALLSVRHPFAHLVECRRADPPDQSASSAADRSEVSSSEEIVVTEVEVSVGQRPKQPIRRREPIALVFSSDPETPPRVLALRADFPAVSHRNLAPAGAPADLCLYDRPWHEVQPGWTPARCIERVRGWLEQTAEGTLHAADQPFEPLFFESPITLILTPELMTPTEDPTPHLLVLRGSETGTGRVLLDVCLPEEQDESEKGRAVLTKLVAAPQPQGPIAAFPESLTELHAVLGRAGLDVLGTLRERLAHWNREPTADILLKHRPLLLLVVPRSAEGDVSPPNPDVWAFLLDRSASEVGEELGLWQVHAGSRGLLLGDRQETGEETIRVVPVDTTPAFTREQAARLNGLPETESPSVAAIGVGALGSQLVTHLIRAGWGQWSMIDPDHLLPHNLARHALFGPMLGRAKALWLAELANHTIAGPAIAKAVVADVLAPGENRAEVEETLRSAEVILDLAASVPVARHLTHAVDSTARRLSLFLNPRGTALVLLAEDADRTTQLDSLEMQYYRAVLHKTALRDHLAPSQGEVRYARACRDVSSRLPGDQVALFAALGSSQVRWALARAEPRALIWTLDRETSQVRRTVVDVRPSVTHQAQGWTIVTDAGLLDHVQELRQARLPNETGGVLLGSFDLDRRVVYVADTIPSPPDSVEWPTVYIRGHAGLEQTVRSAEERTRQMLEYVGEWHAHPPGHACTLSPYDDQALTWLADATAREGLPGLMLIVGDPEQVGWHLREVL